MWSDIVILWKVRNEYGFTWRRRNGFAQGASFSGDLARWRGLNS